LRAPRTVLGSFWATLQYISFGNSRTVSSAGVRINGGGRKPTAHGGWIVEVELEVQLGAFVLWRATRSGVIAANNAGKTTSSVSIDLW